ncbi:MAG: hypothetical protein COY40_03800 [Alphaproteobacteria bacterium CG_4_10_14_0_8_um_filter_53_9]|nr:MAG: hypothetical protein COY40_03800 [Alphaproteobacteria bacterium CG_4_10_14_0_8_um_filter_53_9]
MAGKNDQKRTKSASPRRGARGRFVKKDSSAKKMAEAQKIQRNIPSALSAPLLQNSPAERLAGRIDDVVELKGDVALERRSFASRLKRATSHERWALHHWFEKARAWWWQRTAGVQPVVDPSSLSDVRSGVMHELEHLRTTTRSTVTHAPFDNPFSRMMLPPIKRPRRLPAGWIVFGVLVLGLLTALWWLGRSPVGPAHIVHQTLTALEQGDTQKLDNYVDVDSVAVSLVDYVLEQSQPDLSPLPDVFQSRFHHGLKARMEAFVKPGMALRMAEHIRMLVAEKRVPTVGQDGLVGQLWTDVLGDAFSSNILHVGRAEKLTPTIAAVPLTLVEDASVPPLWIEVDSLDNHWRIVGFTNLADVVNTQNALAYQNVPPLVEIVTELPKPEISVGAITKAKAEEGVILLSADISHVGGGRTPVNMPLIATFADAAGVPLFVKTIMLPDVLEVGQTRTYTWRLLIDVSDTKAGYAYMLPQSAMRVTLEPLF